MPRNSLWSDSDAENVLDNIAVDDASYAIFSDVSGVNWDAEAQVSGYLGGADFADFIAVELTAGASYNFIAEGEAGVALSIFDDDGYLLLYTDLDDLGTPTPRARTPSSASSPSGPARITSSSASTMTRAAPGGSRAPSTGTTRRPC